MAQVTDTQLQLASEQFSTILLMRLQQEKSLFRGIIREGQHVGKYASPVQYINPFAMEAPSGVFAHGNIVQPGYMRRWVSPAPAEKFLGIDSFDQLQTEIDPQSMFVNESTAAVARLWDDRIIAAAFGAATTGTDPSGFSSETWASVNTGFVIADTFDDGSTATGMTVAKLREARRILRHSHALDPNGTQGMPRVNLAMASQQESDMLALTQVVNVDYNPQRDGVPIMEGANIARFMGFEFLFSERLGAASAGTANTRGCFAFDERALYLGIWMDLQTHIFYAEHLSGRPLVVHPMTSIGATRLEPNHLVEVDCYDTIGADNI